MAMAPHDDDSSWTSDTLLSSRQSLWILVALLWFGVSIQYLLTGDTFFGVISLLLGIAGLYHVANP